MEETKELTVVEFNTPELSTIESSKAEQIRKTFLPMADMLTEFEQAYKDIVAESEAGIDEPLTHKAKRLRLDIGRVRIDTEKLRKAEKEEYLRAGKAIDGVSNILKWAVTDKENKLKEIETHFEIQEQKRLDALQVERVSALSVYVEDAADRDLSGMDDDVWQAYLAAKEKEHNDRVAAERRAEEERIAKEKAEAAERKRIEKENKRLKKEAEEREKKAKAEAEERERKAEEERKEREKEETARQKKADAERHAMEAKLKKEAEAREKLEAEKKARKAAEEKARKAAANKAYRKRINNAALVDLEQNGFDTTVAKSIIGLIATGKISHITINY